MNGQWGTVCDDFFVWNEGHVVCHQLNYTGIIRLASEMEFGIGRGPIWLDDVDCRTGDEDYITECSHLEYGNHNCDHSEDVGVVCGESVKHVYVWQSHAEIKKHFCILDCLLASSKVIISQTWWTVSSQLKPSFNLIHACYTKLCPLNRKADETSFYMGTTHQYFHFLGFVQIL